MSLLLLLSHKIVSDSFVTPWTVAHQPPLSMGFFRQEYRSGLPFSPPGDLPGSAIKRGPPASSPLAGGFFAAEQPGKPSVSSTGITKRGAVDDKSMISILALQNPENSCKTTPPLPPYFD